MPDIKKVSFDVVEVWYNDPYTPYTIMPTRKDRRRAFAFKIEEKFFLIGEKDQDSIHICDHPNRRGRDEDA